MESEPQVPAIGFTAPPQFQGEAGFWTPEHYLLAAVAACFVTTFRAIAEISKFEPAGLEISVEGVIEKAEGGFQFTRMSLRPVLTAAESFFASFRQYWVSASNTKPRSII